MARIAIIGLGLIGGSIGLALRRGKVEGLAVAGYDASTAVTSRAAKMGAIDVEARSAAAAVEGAALVIVATPVLQVRAAFEEIAPALGDGAVVTDTASTKRDVLAWAAELLPDTVSFVGGHPVAGRETHGIEAADASLFEGRAWAITPSVDAAERAIQAVENLAALVGARPVSIDAAEHDSYLAAVSHLPLIVSMALFSLACESKAWPELAGLSGFGFRDTTRLASTNPELSHDIVLTNRDNALHWIDRYIEELRRIRALIADESQGDELFKALVQVQTVRDSYMQQLPERPRGTEPEDMLSTGDRMLSLLVGEYAVRRRKDIEKALEPNDGKQGERR